jgi:hypothetical protein
MRYVISLVPLSFPDPALFDAAKTLIFPLKDILAVRSERGI